MTKDCTGYRIEWNKDNSEYSGLKVKNLIDYFTKVYLIYVYIEGQNPNSLQECVQILIETKNKDPTRKQINRYESLTTYPITQSFILIRKCSHVVMQL